MITQTKEINRLDSSVMRQSLKTEIDTLPESIVFTVFEFLSFEKQRFNIASAQNIERKKSAFERLKKYSGTMRLEKHWKEELYEALDEKYNSSC